jgi:hypothetical protein
VGLLSRTRDKGLGPSEAGAKGEGVEMAICSECNNKLRECTCPVQVSGGASLSVGEYELFSDPGPMLRIQMTDYADVSMFDHFFPFQPVDLVLPYKAVVQLHKLLNEIVTREDIKNWCSED